MFKFLQSTQSIGLEQTSLGLQAAVLSPKGTTAEIVSLLTFHPETDDVKPLYMNHPLITTGMSGREVLIRPITLPLTKEKDIAEAISFQAEPMLPYPVDQSLLAYRLVSKGSDSSELTLFACQKKAMQHHIDFWKGLQVEPEKVGSIPSALADFGAAYLPEAKNYLILHLGAEEITCVLIHKGKLYASFAQSEDMNLLLNAMPEEGSAPFPHNAEEWSTIAQGNSTLSEVLKRLQREVSKIGFALIKEARGESLEGVAVTGMAAQWNGLSEMLTQHLQLSLLHCQPTPQHDARELLRYAIPIGLALGSLPGKSHSIDFRQQEAAYPYPWKRLKRPLAAYFGAVLLLSCAFYFFSAQYLSFRENQIKQAYIDLLSGMNKSHEDIETAYVNKNRKPPENALIEIPKIETMGKEDLSLRIAYLQKELQANPDSFPLLANIPRVSDVIAWLHQHHAASYVDEEGKVQPKLQIEHFSYIMIKRPQQGKKQEKYQVKIELEFTSPTPKWAREFHDALIAPNDWIDPKGEVKWNTNRGKYKTSFFLKDKTVYPSS